MSIRLLNSDPSVQVIGNLTSDVLICTFQSLPSGSTLILVIDQTDFAAGTGNVLMNELSTEVEDILKAGVATGAVGVQSIDSSGLLQDNVTFTVTYVPSYSTPGTITGDVTIPAYVITGDSFLFASGALQSAPAQIDAEYERLKALAGE